MVRYKSPLRHQTPQFHQANTLNDKSKCGVDTILKQFPLPITKTAKIKKAAIQITNLDSGPTTLTSRNICISLDPILTKLFSFSQFIKNDRCCQVEKRKKGKNLAQFEGPKMIEMCHCHNPYNSTGIA